MKKVVLPEWLYNIIPGFSIGFSLIALFTFADSDIPLVLAMLLLLYGIYTLSSRFTD